MTSNEVQIVGVGLTPVAEHWDRSLTDLSVEAALAALHDADIQPCDIGAIYVGSGPAAHGHGLLAAALAQAMGADSSEGVDIRMGTASGAAAMRVGYLAVASASHPMVLVVGADKASDLSREEGLAADAASLDAELEAAHGMTGTAVAGLLMGRYLHQFRAERSEFAAFPMLAHANAVHNRLAMYRGPVSPADYATARPLADPLNLLDTASLADGAAAVVLGPANSARPRVRVAGCGVATDSVALQGRQDPLWLTAAARSAERAFRQAGISRSEVDLAEVHDSTSIVAALALEAMGFAERGQATKLAASGAFRRDGRLPLSTMGGLKARGYPGGASGLFQVAEVTLQLLGRASDNQVPGARVGLAQSLAGTAAVAITHILVRED
jgi:acetyl-CoA C-acetyltransferase